MIWFGINYRFSKDESVEWNNPLDAMYGDIANVKTEIKVFQQILMVMVYLMPLMLINTPEGVAVDGKEMH